MNKVIKMQSRKTLDTMPLIERMRVAKWFMFVTAHLQVLCFLFVFYSPSVQATIENIEQQNAVPEVQGNSDEEKLGNALQLIKENVADTKATVDARVEEGGIIESILDFFGLSELQNESLNTLIGLNEQVSDLNEKALEGFAEVEAMLAAKQLPDEIMQRHFEAVNKYQADYQKLQGYIQDAANAESLHDQQEVMDALNAFLEQQKFKRSHQSDDPNNLPFGSPDAEKTRKPITDAQQLSQLINPTAEPQIAEKVLDTFIPKAHAQTTNGPTSADLAETIDVQLTDAIRAKAAELNNNPVEIYNWVRNNIEFIPSYGSIQGADYTLQTLSGNPFDTSSLLIALLRAADIPARYAYGTARIPVDQVMNWVGGVEVPEAAQQLLGQGGIPNIALVQGGVVTDIEMEHIWVEAWVDFEPSRASKNIEGDSWVPLDGSFKQYEFIEALDVQSQVPFDVQQLVDQLTQTATVNDVDGYIEGIDQSQIETSLANYQQSAENFINSQIPNGTIGEIIAINKIIVQDFKKMSAGLPYELLTQSADYSILPDNLRHKFRYTLGTNIFGTEGNRLVTFERSLPELTGKKLALSFRPSSQQDQELLDSFFPEADPVTGEIDPAQIPSSIPGYLLNLTAEFVENDEVVQSAATGRVGEELYETLALWSPSQGWEAAENTPIAGEYRAIGLDFQGISQTQMESLESDIQQTKVILEQGQISELNSLTKRELLGDLLSSTILNYLALTNSQDQMLARSAGIINYRLPSYGVFSTSLITNYLFGIIPRGVNFAGLVIDVDHLATQGVSKDNSKQKIVAYVRQSGTIASAMEHILPEQHFSTASDPVQGISAVKALAIANAEGQRIWNINENNLNEALSAINLNQDIKLEIRRAVNAGKLATVHESPVNFGGGTNAGYLLIDPNTGGGAYKIAGGSNGGFLDWVNENSALLTGIGIGASVLAFLTFTSGGAIFLLAAIVAVVIAISLVIASYIALQASLNGTTCQDSGLLELYAGLQVAAIIIGALAGGFFGALVGSMLISLLANAVPASATSATCPPN